MRPAVTERASATRLPIQTDELQRLRLGRGLTLEKLGRLAHCSPASLSRIENGHRPSEELLLRVGSVFACEGVPTKADVVAAYKRAAVLLDAGELAGRVGCTEATVRRHAPAMEHARRFGNPRNPLTPTPWLFTSDAEDELRARLVEGRENLRRAARASATRQAGVQAKEWWDSPAGSRKKEERRRRQTLPRVLVRCELCGETFERDQWRADEASRLRRRHMHEACQAAYMSALWRARWAISRNGAGRITMVRQVLELAAELERMLSAKRRGRPRDVGMRLTIEALFSWAGFSDADIALVLAQADGGGRDRNTVKRLRHRYGIRRRGMAA